MCTDGQLFFIKWTRNCGPEYRVGSLSLKRNGNKNKTDKNGISVAPQKLNPNGTVKNALDIDDNVMGNVIKIA